MNVVLFIYITVQICVTLFNLVGFIMLKADLITVVRYICFWPLYVLKYICLGLLLVFTGTHKW